MKDLWVDPRLTESMKVLYRDMERRWKSTGDVTGPAWQATNGVLQGCAISVVLLNILVGIWAISLEAEMEERFPEAEVKASGYADDTKKLCRLQSTTRWSLRH